MWLTQADHHYGVELHSMPSHLRLSKQNERAIVFLAHHDSASRSTMAEMLSEKFDVRQFETGEQTLAALEASWPDVAVLDVALDGLDGVEVCRRMKARARGQPLPVVLVTAPDRPGDRSRALDVGVDEFIGTPLYASELVARVSNLSKLAWHERQQGVASERMKALEAQLEEAERLATMGTFASGLGHEMTNVVTVLRSALEEVRRSNTDAEVVADLFSATAKLEELSGAVRRLGSPPRVEGVVDLREVVRDVVWMTRVVGRTKYVVVDVALPDMPVVARVPTGQIQQVVLNLLTNAADALTMSRAGRIAVALSLEEGVVHLQIKDNGPGFSPDAHHDQPFYTTKRAGLGTGLGLTLVKQLVAGWGGTIELASSSAGTTVEVVFPAERPSSGS